MTTQDLIQAIERSRIQVCYAIDANVLLSELKKIVAEEEDPRQQPEHATYRMCTCDKEPCLCDKKAKIEQALWRWMKSERSSTFKELADEILKTLGE